MHYKNTSMALAALLAAPGVLAASPELGLSASLDYQHQIFEDSSSNIYTLSLTPTLQSGDWLLALDLPLQRASGEEFIIGNRPQAGSLCNRLARGNQLGAQLPERLQDLSGQCAEDGEEVIEVTTTTNSGVGDISAFASYGRNLGESPWYASATLGYQADNGDESKGLGSGTRDLFSELQLETSRGKLGASLMLGYNKVIGGIYEDYAEDYFYTRLEARARPGDSWSFGGHWEFQQAAIIEADEVQSLGLFAELSPSREWRLRTSWRHYLSGDYYPENTVSASASYWF